MSVSTHRLDDGSHDDLDPHGWLGPGQINWEDFEDLWQAWGASDQADQWSALSASWHGDDRGDDAIEADDVDQVPAGADDQHQGQLEDNSAPNAEAHHGNEQGETQADDADGDDDAQDDADHEHQGPREHGHAAHSEKHD